MSMVSATRIIWCFRRTQPKIWNLWQSYYCCMRSQSTYMMMYLLFIGFVPCPMYPSIQETSSETCSVTKGTLCQRETRCASGCLCHIAENYWPLLLVRFHSIFILYIQYQRFRNWSFAVTHQECPFWWTAGIRTSHSMIRFISFNTQDLQKIDLI